LINCSNCGAPISPPSGAAMATCTHCGHETPIPQASSTARGGGSGGGSSGGGSSGGGGGGGNIPAIVIVNAPAPQAQPIRSSPVIVVSRGTRYRSSFSIFGSLFTLLIIYGVYWWAMHMRNNIASTVNAAEHAAEHANEHTAPPAEKKKK
jgi:hypothetical protein